jgi:hypothetical protein
LATVEGMVMLKGMRWLLVVLVLMACVGIANAAPITIFSQNYSQIGALPSNVALLNPLSPFNTDVLGWGYNGGVVYLSMANAKNTGDLTIGGLTPAVVTNYTIVMDINKTTTGSTIYIKGSGMYWQIQKVMSTGNMAVTQYYYDATTGVLSNNAYTVLAWTYPFTFSVQYDGANRTYTSRVGNLNATTPLIETDKGNLSYNTVSGSLLRFYSSTSESNETISIYSINQTIEGSGNITAIGDRTLVPIGFDYPYIGEYENGSETIATHGGKYTVWYDVNAISAGNNANITACYNQGKCEVGIHYAVGLTNNASVANAEAGMVTETASITNALGGIAPTSFCSLANQDNTTFAKYAYTNFGQIWRNGQMGTSQYTNIGNLDNATWPFWNNASIAGISIPSFTHRTDIDPAVTYSIDTSKFLAWEARYRSSGMKITSFIDWYKTGENQKSATFTENTFLPGELENFTSHTNGYPALVEVDLTYSADNIVRNTTGAVVNSSSSPDGKTQFYVNNGDRYTIDDGTYTWDFGDGQFSGLQNPTHTYTVPGTYDVNLTVCGAGPVAAVFSGTPLSGAPPLTTTFTDASTFGAGDAACDSEVKTAYVSTFQHFNITGLTASATSSTAILWGWTNPTATDFNTTDVWKNGVLYANYTNTTTGVQWNDLTASTTYTFSAKAHYLNGDRNESWLNATATTASGTAPARTPVATTNYASIIFAAFMLIAFAVIGILYLVANGFSGGYRQAGSDFTEIMVVLIILTIFVLIALALAPAFVYT